MRTRDGEVPRVVALVPSWNRAEHTLRCLEDLSGCGYPRLRVVLLDNGSRDGTPARVAERFPQVDLLAFPENLGYCAAVNRGIARAAETGVPYVLLLNNDVRLAPGFLEPLVEALEADGSAACAGPTMLLPDGRVWCAGGRIRFGPNVSVLRGNGGRDPGSFRYPVPVDYMPGACALYRREDLEAVGGLCEDYFMYMEDVDLGERLKGRGRRVLHVPWSRVVHEVSASTGGGLSSRRKYMVALNSVRFLRRYGTPARWLAFVVCDVAAWPVVALAALLRGRLPRAESAKALGLLRGLLGGRVTAAEVEGGRLP